MSFPLKKLCGELHISIFCKVQPKTLANLRLTCKAVDDFVEINRFHIQCHVNDMDWCLRFEVSAKKKPLRVSILAGLNKIWGSEAYQIMRKQFSKRKTINYPYKQLSGFRFNVTVVMFDAWDLETYPQITKGQLNEIQLNVWNTQLKDLLTRLRIKCDKLKAWRLPILGELVHLVKFSKLIANYSDIDSSEFLSWPVWHCKEHVIDSMDAPTHLSSFTRQLQRASYSFSRPHYEKNLCMFQNFLKDIRRSRQCRGKLEFIKISFDLKDEDISKISGLVELWKGQTFTFQNGDPSSFYYTQIDGGLATITKDDSTCSISFAPEGDIRETIFHNFFPIMFSRFPLDTSAVYESFLSSETHQTALAELYDPFSPFYNDLMERGRYLDGFFQRTAQENRESEDSSDGDEELIL